MVNYVQEHETRGLIIDTAEERSLHHDVGVAMLVLYEHETTPTWTFVEDLEVFINIELCRQETVCMQ